MALAIDTNHMLQHCIPYNEPLRMGRSRGRYELHKLHTYATAWSVHTSSTPPVSSPATQAALDWQADQADVLDDLEVLHHLKHMAKTCMFPDSTQDSYTTLVASVQSPIFSLRAQGRPPTSFNRYSLRMIVFEYNYYVCNIFGYDFNGMDESGIGETNMRNVLLCDGIKLLPWFLSPRIVWAAEAENPAVLWLVQLDFVDLLTPSAESRKRRRPFNPIHQVASAAGASCVPETKRFKGVRYRPDRRTWVAEMRPPKCKNKVSFGDFRCQTQAARAVDAAFYYFNRRQNVNFADSCEILTRNPPPVGLSEEDKLKFVKEQAKWMAAMASSLPPTPTSVIATNALDSVHSLERSRGLIAFRFRSFSEITSPSSSHTDRLALENIADMEGENQGQSVFRWMLEHDHEPRVGLDSQHEPGIMSPETILDCFTMSPPAPLFQW